MRSLHTIITKSVGVVVTTLIVGIFAFVFQVPQVKAITVTSISNNIVLVGTVYTVTGTNFGETKKDLYFSGFSNNRANTEIISWSDTNITFRFTSIAKSYLGDSTLNTGYINISNGTTWVSGPDMYFSPTITSTPLPQIIYVGGSIELDGDHFGSTLGSVTIDGQSSTIISWSANKITVSVPSITFEAFESYRLVPVVAYSFDSSVSKPVIPSEPYLVKVYRVISNDPYSYLQPSLSIVGTPEAWNVPVNKRTIVAVIDDGVYVNHPDLVGRIWKNTKESIGNKKDDDHNGYVDDIYGWNFIKNSGEMTTYGSHGTMVAGIIAANRNNEIGIAGINPNSLIMPLIVCNENGCPGNIDKAIRYAVDNGADVINLSLGTNGTTGYTTSLNEAILYAYQKGVVVVAAAGNGDTEGGNGQDLSFIPQSPVCNDAGKNAVIGVGAIANDRSRPVWANYGKCVDVSAPGVGIVSTSVPATSSLGGFYDMADGTSFSAPMISGLVSLMRQQSPTMPINEIQARINRHSDSGVINAIGLLGEPYVQSQVPSGPTELTPSSRPASKSLALTKGVYAYKLNGKTISIRPFGTDYRGIVWARSVDFGSEGKIYIFLNSGAYKKGQIKVYKSDGKLLKAYNPYGGFATSGLNVTDSVESNNRVYLTVGAKGGGTTVKTYQVVPKGLHALNALTASPRTGNILVGFQKVYKGSYGLVTMRKYYPSTLKVWKLDPKTNKFVEDKKINKTKIKI